MPSLRTFVISLTISAASFASLGAVQASETLTFNSPGGAMIASAGPTVTFNTSTAGVPDFGPGVIGFNHGIGGLPFADPALGAAYNALGFPPRHKRGVDGGFYNKFLFAPPPYSAFYTEYYRLFAPAYAISTWTDRIAGLPGEGFGGAVDGWTAAAYYLGRLGGPRRNSPPDLTLLPKFRPHPELEDVPTFQPN